MDRLEDLSGLKIKANAPHPVTGCDCSEGRILTDDDRHVRHFLPAVHDCDYIVGANAVRRRRARKARLAARKTSPLKRARSKRAA